MDSQSNLINIRFIYEDSNYDIQIGTEEEVLDLKKKIKNEIEKNKNVKVNEGNVSIKLGFPPKTIEGSCDDSKTMKELRISNNEQLRVEIKNLILQNESVKSENINENLQDSSIDYSKYSIYRKVIPANNCCLFNSVNYFTMTKHRFSFVSCLNKGRSKTRHPSTTKYHIRSPAKLLNYLKSTLTKEDSS